MYALWRSWCACSEREKQKVCLPLTPHPPILPIPALTLVSLGMVKWAYDKSWWALGCSSQRLLHCVWVIGPCAGGMLVTMEESSWLRVTALYPQASQYIPDTPLGLRKGGGGVCVGMYFC